MQIVRREQPSVAVELEHRRPVGLLRGKHLRLCRQLAALLQIAGGAGGDHVVPAGHAAARARHQMVEGEVLIVAAILADEPVAQEHVESGESGIARRPDIGLERHHARQLHLEGGGADAAVIFGDDIDAVEEHRLHRVLPAPEGERVVAQGPVVGVEHERGKRARRGGGGGDVQGGKSFKLARRTRVTRGHTIGTCQLCEGP